MNWETAKTWLIGAFLILDVILGWQLVQSRREMQGYVESSSDLLADTKTLLAEHGLSLATRVPESHPDMSSLHAQAPDVPLRDVGRAAFPKAKTLVIDNTAGTVSTREGRIQFQAIGTWQVDYTPPMAPGNHGVRGWLDNVWKGNEYVEDAADTLPIVSSSAVPVFVEKYQGFPIFDAQVIFQLAGKQLAGYTQSAIVNVYSVGGEKPIISALDALDGLANAVDKSMGQGDNRILKIDLGYHQKVAIDPLGSPLAASDYWFPVWRVITAQQVYYINAFTGEVDAAE